MAAAETKEEQETKETKKKGLLKTLLSDSQWDWDLSKVAGLGVLIMGCVGFMLEKNGYLAVMGFGAALLGWKSAIEGC